MSIGRAPGVDKGSEIEYRIFTMKEITPTAKSTNRRHTVPEACCSLDISGVDEERLVKLFKALGNPLRFQILKFLVTHPGCITGDIVGALPIAQATVSQHLKVLRGAGWIVGTIEGPAICYELDEGSVQWFREMIGVVF